MKRNIITLILALAAVCGCQKTEKTIYKVPLSEHAMELERQEKAYNDSLEKYSALLDTAQVRYYFDLHKAVLDTLGVVMQQEVEAFMAAKDKEAAYEENSSMTTELILLGVAIIIIRSLFTPNYLTLANDSCFGEEDLTDEDIHEIMNLIHKGNPPKYEIKERKKAVKIK